MFIEPIVICLIEHRNGLQHAFPRYLNKVCNPFFTVRINLVLPTGEYILELLKRSRVYVIGISDEYIEGLLNLRRAVGGVGDGHQLDYLLIG
jgi:hypothetical protein